MAEQAELGALRHASALAGRLRASRRSRARFLCGLAGALWPLLSLLRSASPASASVEPIAALATDTQTQETIELNMLSKDRTPFLVAAVVFGVQAVTTLCCTWVVQFMTRSASVTLQGEGSRDLLGILGALQLYLVISSACFFSYTYFAFGSNKIVFVFLPGAGDVPHLGLRNLLWLITTPLQWLCFSRACTKASARDVSILMGSTVMMQALGICMLLVSAPFLWNFFFMTSTLALVLMFWKSFQLPLQPEFELIVRPILYTELFLWFLYPLTVTMRASDFIGTWTEQVIVYTVLDVVAKTVSLSAILMAHVHIVCQRVNAALVRAGSAYNNAGQQIDA